MSVKNQSATNKNVIVENSGSLDIRDLTIKVEDKYETRLKKLNLLSLEQRRALADVSFFYKALNGIINIDVQPYVEYYSERDRYSLRHSDNLTLKRNRLEH